MSTSDGAFFAGSVVANSGTGFASDGAAAVTASAAGSSRGPEGVGRPELHPKASTNDRASRPVVAVANRRASVRVQHIPTPPLHDLPNADSITGGGLAG